MVQSIGTVSQRSYPAERHELISYYQSYVCATTCELVLNMCRDQELRRLVFIGVYAREYTSVTNRGRIVEKLSRALGLSRATGFNYANQYDLTRVRQVK
jgi:hypothetical protein